MTENLYLVIYCTIDCQKEERIVHCSESLRLDITIQLGNLQGLKSLQISLRKFAKFPKLFENFLNLRIPLILLYLKNLWAI